MEVLPINIDINKIGFVLLLFSEVEVYAPLRLRPRARRSPPSALWSTHLKSGVTGVGLLV